jgi:hypothetical protein
MNTLISLLRDLGFAINWNKVEGPVKCLKFLGIIINSQDMSLRLPEDKLLDFHDIIEQALRKKRASLKFLQRLAGKLNWASQIVQGGRTYLRRILDALQPLKLPHHKAILSGEVRADLLWWQSFLRVFNGKVLALHAATPTHTVYTDACNWGAGIVYNGEWEYINWGLDLPNCSEYHINYKETLAIVLAVHKWAPYWQNSHVLIWSDNITAKACLNKGTCRNPNIMCFLRYVNWLKAVFNFVVTVKHIEGTSNKIADCVSCLHEQNRFNELDMLLNSGAGNFSLDNIFVNNHMSPKSVFFLMQQIVRWLMWKLHWIWKWQSTAHCVWQSPLRNVTVRTGKHL